MKCVGTYELITDSSNLVIVPQYIQYRAVHCNRSGLDQNLHFGVVVSRCSETLALKSYLTFFSIMDSVPTTEAVRLRVFLFFSKKQFFLNIHFSS